MKKLILALTVVGTITVVSCSRTTYSDMYYDPLRGTEEPNVHGGKENLENADHIIPPESPNSNDAVRDMPTLNEAPAGVPAAVDSMIIVE